MHLRNFNKSAQFLDAAHFDFSYIIISLPNGIKRIVNNYININNFEYFIINSKMPYLIRFVTRKF